MWYVEHKFCVWGILTWEVGSGGVCIARVRRLVVRYLEHLVTSGDAWGGLRGMVLLGKGCHWGGL